MRVAEWVGCYDKQWRGLIVPEAFSHPAKFAPGLIDRIFKHGLARGYWRTGDLIGDPFGGIAGGGIMAAYNRLGWVGVELEPRFVDLGNENIALHRAAWEAHGFPVPVLVQGDSRRFSEVVGASWIVTSPPFVGVEAGGPAKLIQPRPGDVRAYDRTMTAQDGYGTTPGQIGALKAGDLGAVVTSPPYRTGGHHNDPMNHTGRRWPPSMPNVTRL
jgi:hypothetical protein